MLSTISIFHTGIGQNIVPISDEQLEDLLTRLSGPELEHYIAIIVENEQRGHHYTKKIHYQAVLDMALRDR